MEFDHPAAQTIIRSSPHRVCLSRLGRCEVFQRIPWKPNESSPTGPHTHVLSDLLKHRRSHSANIPIPEGYVGSLHLHPANPNSDTLGNPKEFARGEFDEFQELLGRYGPPAYLAEKKRIFDAVKSGEDPTSYKPATTRLGRAGTRIALRQLAHTFSGLTNLEAWRNIFDRVGESSGVAHGH